MTGTPGFISDWPAGVYPGDRGTDATAQLGRKVADSIRQDRVIHAIRCERWAQDSKWGQQNHRDGTSIMWREWADLMRSTADKLAAQGVLSWADILFEEFYEAMAETDEDKLREELIQVAAVATAWVECIDRRHAR